MGNITNKRGGINMNKITDILMWIFEVVLTIIIFIAFLSIQIILAALPIAVAFIILSWIF